MKIVYANKVTMSHEKQLEIKGINIMIITIFNAWQNLTGICFLILLFKFSTLTLVKSYTKLR